MMFVRFKKYVSKSIKLHFLIKLMKYKTVKYVITKTTQSSNPLT